MKIISKRQFECGTNYLRSFEYKDPKKSGSGFAFPCNEKGEVDIDKLNPAALQNFTDCLVGSEVIDQGVVAYPWRQTIPAIGECDYCGEQVELHGFTNTCECGADYNSSGQSLAPRSQWAEETGETVDDILSVDNVSIDDCFDCI
jgi:hypothetical protein